MAMVTSRKTLKLWIFIIAAIACVTGTIKGECVFGCKTCNSSKSCIECHVNFNITSSKHCQGPSQPARECIDTTTCRCCAGTCVAKDSCNGKCKHGYHGDKCRNRCPPNCVLCADSTNESGFANCTLCKDGYFSTPSEFQCQQPCRSECRSCDGSTTCTACRDGEYLTDDKLCDKCSESCLLCDSASSCTACKHGYYNDKGTCKACGPLCQTCTSSANNCVCSIGCVNKCDTSNGDCIYGCKSNFDNGPYGKCDTCTLGFYGNKCDTNCSVNCQTKCDRVSGICLACKPGYFGNWCTPCPGKCVSACNEYGHCDACKDGYYGPNCTLRCPGNCATCSLTGTMCTKCHDGFFGKNCKLTCSDNCVLNTCDKNSGQCECKPGYEGDICQIKLTTQGTTVIRVLVITDDPDQFMTRVLGGTIGLMALIGVLIAVSVFLKRRNIHRYSQYVIEMDSYRLDSRLIDVLEENDEFDPTYFTGTVDDTKKPCGKLPVKELAQFVDSHGVDYLQEEFLKLPRGLIKSCDDAKKDENIVKNRYTGIYPYDEHRVRLLPPGSDFINACYIDGFKMKKEYIASLGPTIKAMEHFQLFWRMVWQEKTDVIVMVTNLMEGQAMKCEKYWPDLGRSSTYGDVTVTSLSEETYSEFVVKKFLVARDGEERELYHVHYTAWPDKRVPDDITSLIEFRQKVKSFKPVLGGPTIVHCSAGIGRTGTYIALDILINQGKAQKALDIFDWVTRMREQRTSMVQTWQQYEYLHYALVHALTYHCQPIKAKKFQHFMNTATEKRMRGLFKQFQQKEERVTETELAARQMNTNLQGVNRDGADIPGNMYRPVIHVNRKNQAGSTYINAIYVNSYTVKNRFLIAQTPLPETVKDFLTLITQKNCSCIVSMDPPGIKDQTLGEYFSPVNGGTSTSIQFCVETQELDYNPSYILRRLTVQFNKRSGSTIRTLYHYQCNHWPQGNWVPTISHFLQLVQDVEVIADRDNGPVLVHCLNAADRSGLFCAVSNLIQKMRLEGEVSVVNTLRQIKVRRPLAIPNQDQYVFCYQCVLQFVTSDSASENDDLAIYGNI